MMLGILKHLLLGRRRLVGGEIFVARLLEVAWVEDLSLHGQVFG